MSRTRSHRCATAPARHARPLRRLSSARNPVLKEARALHAKKVRARRQLLLAEGEDLLEAALAAGIVPTAVLFNEERFDDEHPLVAATEAVAERYLVPAELIAGASTLAAQPRVIAILPQPEPASFATVDLASTCGVYLAGVADPGNVGTIIRSAAALGAGWVGLGPGSSDPYHPRAARAAMGSTFALPLLIGVSAEDLSSRDGLRIIAAVAIGGIPPWEADLVSPHVLALGAERHGLEPSIELLEGRFPLTRVTIPQVNGAESLNVSAAAAALLAESRRQFVTQG